LIQPVVSFLVVFFLCTVLRPALLTADEDQKSPGHEQSVITAIEVEGLTRFDKDDLIDLICFDKGDVFNAGALRQGIRRAFKTGVFRDIRVFSEPYDGGIRLRYSVREASLVNKIIIQGNTVIKKRALRNVFLFKEGDDFSGDLLAHAREELLSYYRRKGYPDAAVVLQVADADRPGSVNIQVRIIEGAPRMVTSIRVPDEVRPHMRTGVHSIFDRDVVDADIKRIREYYKERKYLHPEVGPYRFDNGELVIPVKKGPKITVVFTGNRSFRKKKFEKLLSFVEEEKVLDEMVDESAERIKSLYTSKGFYNTVVKSSVERGKDIKVTFSIEEGIKTLVDDISFEGMTIPESAVMKIIGLKKGRPFNQDQLDADVESIKNFYYALGYIRMNITDVRKDFRNGDRKVGIHYVIEEGPQVTTGSVDVTGNASLSRDEVMKAVRIQEGSPYNLVDIGDARFRLISLYKQRGFARAVVNVKSSLDGDRAHLFFQVKEGRPYSIGKIVLRGNRKTKAKIIRRELTFEEGDVYNYDEIIKVKQHLYKLGIFSEVQVKTVETGRVADGHSVIDLVIAVKEGKAGSVEFGLGYADYEKLRAMFDISYGNLGGYNRRIGFKAEGSSVKERYVFHFQEPWLFNEPDIPLNLSILKENRKAINLDTKELLYKIDKIGLLAGIEKPLTERLTLNLGYEYSFTDTKDVEEGVILSKEDTGTLGISSITPSLVYDGRDDPFDPTRGSLLSVAVKFASPLILSETGFIKTTFKSSWYVPLHRRIVFAFALSGGAAFSFEDAQELPLIERYFLGGRTTVRGFEQDMLGPKGQDGLPTGGNIFALVNSEFRFSIGKGFGLVAFVDGGNVWRTSGEINEDLRYTAGGGLRYKTPVGPVRIDYGHKINRKEGESAGEVHFSFGHAF